MVEPTWAVCTMYCANQNNQKFGILDWKFEGACSVYIREYEAMKDTISNNMVLSA